MKEKEPARNTEEREENGSRSEGSRPRFNREDSTANKEEAYKEFTKDRRPRARISSEKVEYRPRTDHGERPRYEARGEGERQERRSSYNPNFTQDNRPAFEKREYQPRENRYQDQNRQYDKPYSERREYGERSYDRKPSYGSGEGGRSYNNDGGNRSYNNDRPRYGEQKPYGERKQYGENKPYERKSYGDNTERRQYGDRPSYTPRERSYGEDGGQRREWQGDNRQQGSSYGSDRPRTGGYQRDGRRPGGYQRDGQQNSGGYQRDGQRSGGYQRDNRGYGDNNERGGYRQQGGDARQGFRKPYNKDNRGAGQRREYTPMYDSTNYPTFPIEQTGEAIRLNRYIAMSGICSRREADEHIQAGKVTVNGEVVTELGAKVQPADEVRYEGELLQNEKKVYIVMNKPKGYVTSVEDPHADKTVMELLANGCKERVYPVGRLDKNSLGVLLITNDGDLAKKLTHPTYQKKKIYQVTLDKPLTRSDMNTIAEGVELEDGEIHADAISYVGVSKNEVGIEIHSGRNRIVRRIFEHLGYRVMKLDRVYFAGLTKQKLKRGQWRFLTPREVQALRSGRYE